MIEIDAPAVERVNRLLGSSCRPVQVLPCLVLVFGARGCVGLAPGGTAPVWTSAARDGLRLGGLDGTGRPKFGSQSGSPRPANGEHGPDRSLRARVWLSAHRCSARRRPGSSETPGGARGTTCRRAPISRSARGTRLSDGGSVFQTTALSQKLPTRRRDDGAADHAELRRRWGDGRC